MAEEKMHIFLTGDRQAGKSFLLQRVLQELDVPLSGFTTAWGEADAQGTAPLIFTDIARQQSAAAALRYSDGRKRQIFSEVFETLGVSCLKNPQGLVIMDELGRFEASAEAFCDAVFSVLDSDIPVFGVVRDMEMPFLDAVRNHPKTAVIRVTPENREELFGIVLAKIREILR